MIQGYKGRSPHEEVVINARETCLFDEKVKTYKSPLIDEDGTIFGTCGVANDVTAQHNINSELEIILDGMPFAVIINDEKEDVLAANRLFFKYFPEYSEIVGTNLSSWKNSVLRAFSERSEFSTLGASVGAACGTAYDGNAQDFEKLLKMSDRALYTAKKSGKDKICFFGEE